MAKGKYDRWLTPEGLLQIEGWARDGLTDEQIAHNMGCSRSTLTVWRSSYPAISDALKKGKEVVDREVENALLKRAIGYEYTEEQVTISKKDGRKITQTVKQVVPDTTAQIFWLKNRCPEKWRDKIDHTPTDVPNLPDDGFKQALADQATVVWKDGDDDPT